MIKTIRPEAVDIGDVIQSYDYGYLHPETGAPGTYIEGPVYNITLVDGGFLAYTVVATSDTGDEHGERVGEQFFIPVEGVVEAWQKDGKPVPNRIKVMRGGDFVPVHTSLLDYEGY